MFYKNPSTNGKHSIAVIDPNNFEFSLHLSNEDLRTEIINKEFSKIITFKDKRKIYCREEGFERGFAPDKYRDCVDIAVKLAFYLSFQNILIINRYVE